MPVVPRYNPGQVNQAPLPGARVSVDAPIEAFGGGQSRVTDAVQGLTEVGVKFARQEQERADDVVFLDRDKQLSELQTSLEIKAQQMLGKDAAGAGDYVKAEWAKGLENINKGLTGNQKARLDKAVQARFGNMSKQVSLHTANEGKRFADVTTKAYVATARGEGIRNAHDPERVKLSFEQQRAAIDGQFEREGALNSPAHTRARQESDSATHTGIVDHLIALKLDQKAQEYYDSNKDSILPEDADKILGKLKESTTRGESQRVTDQLMTLKTGWKGRFAEADKLLKDKPEVREAVEQRLNHLMSRESNIKQQAQHDNSLMIINKIESRKALIKNLQAKADIAASKPDDPNLALSDAEQAELAKGVGIPRDMIPEGVWNTLEKSQRDGINAMAAENNVADNSKTFYQLQQLGAFSATRAEFLNTNLLAVAHKMSPGDLTKLMEYQKGLRAGDERIVQRLDGVQAHTAIVNSAVKATFTQKKNPSTEDEERERVFRSAIDVEVLQESTAKGRPLTNPEVETIVNRARAKVVINESGFFGPTTSEKARWEIEVGDVPVMVRTKIEAALRARGRPVTDANVLYIFRNQRPARGK